MTTEFDLRCAACGGQLRESAVEPDAIRFDVTTAVAVAECTECGGRYYPERTLDRLHRSGR